MPELPEVETVVTDLRPELTGRRVRDAQLGLAKMLKHPDPVTFAARIVGQRVAGMRRHGKLMAIDLEQGDGLYVHLGMTGRLTVCAPEEPVLKHTHLVLALDDGRELRYHDPRQFGRLLFGTEVELRRAGVFPRLGPDPLGGDFTFGRFAGLLGRRHRPIKAALLDQSLIAGLGNIYADESCFAARIRPTRRIQRVSVAERRALYGAIQTVLQKSIRNRGSSVDDYRDGFGAPGNHQGYLLVYGRAGAPCVQCSGPLKKVRLAGRGTVYCPRCQR
jgi:formamidopyrimidine-DNA glycosylase